MKISRILLLVSLAAFLSEAAVAAGFKVIVHSSNATRTISRVELARIFIKKKTHWPNGTPIAAVDLVEESTARQEFSRVVMNKSVGSMKSYWHQQIFSGRDVPPVEKASDADVVAFVKANPGAIGYVAGDTPSAGVAAIAITD